MSSSSASQLPPPGSSTSSRTTVPSLASLPARTVQVRYVVVPLLSSTVTERRYGGSACSTCPGMVAPATAHSTGAPEGQQVRGVRPCRYDGAASGQGSTPQTASGAAGVSSRNVCVSTGSDEPMRGLSTAAGVLIGGIRGNRPEELARCDRCHMRNDCLKVQRSVR